MVAATRLDCALGSAALMRRATVEASWHCSQRRAFGALLVDQPAMTSVLADLSLESEAATLLAMRVAHTFDSSNEDHEQALRRILLPLAKFWVTKRAASHVGEALECIGGNGYVEESHMPRLYREAPGQRHLGGLGQCAGTGPAARTQRNPTAYDAWRSEIAGVDGRLAEALADGRCTRTCINRLSGERIGRTHGGAVASSASCAALADARVRRLLSKPIARAGSDVGHAAAARRRTSDHCPHRRSHSTDLRRGHRPARELLDVDVRQSHALAAVDIRHEEAARPTPAEASVGCPDRAAGICVRRNSCLRGAIGTYHEHARLETVECNPAPIGRPRGKEVGSRCGHDRCRFASLRRYDEDVVCTRSAGCSKHELRAIG